MKVARKDKWRKLHGFSHYKNIANFEVFWRDKNFSKNLLFLGSDIPVFKTGRGCWPNFWLLLLAPLIKSNFLTTYIDACGNGYSWNIVTTSLFITLVVQILPIQLSDCQNQILYKILLETFVLKATNWFHLDLKVRTYQFQATQ